MTYVIANGTKYILEERTYSKPQPRVTQAKANILSDIFTAIGVITIALGVLFI